MPAVKMGNRTAQDTVHRDDERLISQTVKSSTMLPEKRVDIQKIEYYYISRLL
jgi:hypothetical protein